MNFFYLCNLNQFSDILNFISECLFLLSLHANVYLSKYLIPNVNRIVNIENLFVVLDSKDKINGIFLFTLQVLKLRKLILRCFDLLCLDILIGVIFSFVIVHFIRFVFVLLCEYHNIYRNYWFLSIRQLTNHSAPLYTR